MIAVGWGCWSIRDFPFDTWRLGVVDALSVCDHIDFPGMSDFRVGLVEFTGIHWQDMILNSGDCHVPIFGFPCSVVEMTFVACQ
jgi:hypothetical protein